MMKRALVIGANEEAVFSIRTAQRHGLWVDAMDGNEKAKGLPAADEAYPVDINDLTRVFEITDRLQPCAVVPAPIGHCLTTIGAVNDRYHLAGVSQAAAEKCTDKYRFHQAMREAGLRNAELVLLKEGQKVREEELSGMTRFPVIVKPRFGSGSRGVEICGNRQELLCFLQYELGKDTGLPEEEPAFYEKCCRLMQKTGEAMGFRNCVVHADLIRERREDGTLTDEPFVIETSARPSGHNLSNLFTPLSTGVTLVEDFLKLALPELMDSRNENAEGLFRPEKTRKLLIRYFDLAKGTVRSVPDPGELKERYPLLDYVCHIRPGDQLAEVRDGASVMGRGYYILEGENDAQLDAADEKLRAEFRVQT